MAARPSMPWSPINDGLAIDVRLTPKSSKEAVEGVAELSNGRTALTARVRAAPEKGKANKALEKLIASFIGRPPSTVSVARGQTARLKTVHVRGDTEELLSALKSAIGEDG